MLCVKTGTTYDEVDIQTKFQDIWDQSGTLDAQGRFWDCPGESWMVGSPVVITLNLIRWDTMAVTDILMKTDLVAADNAFHLLPTQELIVIMQQVGYHVCVKF